MKKNKLDRFETKKSAEITPEQDRQNREIIAALLMPIIEKVENLPVVPVAESVADLMKQFDNPKRSPVIVNRVDGRRVQVSDAGEIVEIEKRSEVPAEATKHNSGGSEDSSDDTGTLTPEQNRILAEFLNETNTDR